uniref:RING-type domain-containing protein n=1 Tax=Rhodosorus marinus TaxID=101924 RepID=A0A7S0BI84_9RHOD|mmetsp:Transcript_16381/g.23687  ORF Transcript_16381/g.23687 Transcript_16381/m.23687 type:complete len:173 (+) Transcript_16381:570-1088(+)
MGEMAFFLLLGIAAGLVGGGIGLFVYYVSAKAGDRRAARNADRFNRIRHHGNLMAVNPEAYSGHPSSSRYTGPTQEDVNTFMQSISRPEFKVDEEIGECGVCLDDLSTEASEVFLSPTCKHNYHLQCVGKWVFTRSSLNCPYCQLPFESNGSSLPFSNIPKSAHANSNRAAV